jgi:hypothetical protein
LPREEKVEPEVSSAEGMGWRVCGELVYMLVWWERWEESLGTVRGGRADRW